MTTAEAIKELQKERDLIATERDIDGSQFAPEFLEALAMAIEVLKAQDMTLYMNLPEVSAEEAVEILKRNNRIELLPPAQLEKRTEERTETHGVCLDVISRQAAIDAIDEIESEIAEGFGFEYEKWRKYFCDLPPAQPERRCVNCGRTVNNGGWYEDGRTRCPIEEHYALPKDGYCHLWEKRKDWEDDYVKRAEEGEK